MDDIPVVQRTSRRCDAKINNTIPCPNLAMAGSVYCWAHRNLQPEVCDDDTADLLQVDDRKAQPAAPESASGDDDSLDFVDRMASSSGAPVRQDRLAQEFARFSRTAQLLTPAGTPIPSPEDVDRLLRRLLGPLYDRLLAGALGEYFNPEVLKGLFLVSAYILRAQTASVRRRMAGDYELDDFGRDAAFLGVLMPLAQALYDSYWRVEVAGAEHIPDSGRGLLVANHSGTVAVESMMTQLAIWDHHPAHRHLRMLGADFVFQLPLVGELARKGGHTLACAPDAERLLSSGELVGVWPEGFKGIGKPFSERYKLQRFGRGGFVAAALRTKTPIIPCSIVGAEEIYPIIGNAKLMARLVGAPYFPITPTFPWLGPLGMVPLPSKWIIEFGEPIRTDEFPEGAADDPMLVFDLTDQVRETIQQTLYRLLVARRSVFF